MATSLWPGDPAISFTASTGNGYGGGSWSVALEDLGIAAPNVAAELVAIATLPAARRLLGGDLPALDIALARACSAAKDRTGDHLASIVTREPLGNMDRAALTASPNARLAMLASSDLPWTHRLHAAVIASGRAEPQGGFRVNPGSGIAAVFDVLHELGVPPLLLAACESYASRQRDTLPVLVPFAWLLREPGFSMDRVVIHDLPAAER